MYFEQNRGAMNKTEKSFSLAHENSKANNGCYEGRRLEAWGDE